MRPHFERLFYRWGYTSRAFALLEWASRMTGRRAANLVARQIARAYVATNREVVETVRRNLCLLHPQATTAMAAEVFSNFALGLADYWMLGHLPVATTAGWCEQRSGMEHLEAARSGGRGAILATGHFGLFEYGALLLAEKNLPITVLTLSEPTPELTTWRAAYRRRWGAETIEIGTDAFSSLRVVEALRQNRFCALLVDRPFGGPSVQCPLPGGSIPISLSAALLAHLGQCPIVPVTTNRLPGTEIYRMAAHAPIHLDATLPREEALASATREMARVLSLDFCQHPTSWYHFAPISEPQ